MKNLTSTRRILVIDNDTERANMSVQALEANGYIVVARPASPDALIRQVEVADADVILIGVDSPGQDTLKHLDSISQSRPRPIIMFTQDGRPETIQAATRAGVSAYVVGGLSSERIQPILEAALARFREFQALRQELEKTKATLAERKIIERAKGIIMEQRNCTEAEAYRMLQKLAMDQKRKLVEIAQNVLSVVEVLKHR
jgi:two-component system, response regulator / RNA-binding antiterminator